MKLIVQIVFILYLFCIIPFLVGILEVCIFKKSRIKMSEILSNGYLGMMACFCIVSVLAVQMEWALSRLAFVWAGIVAAISVFAILFGRKQIKRFLEELSKFWKSKDEQSDRAKGQKWFLLMLVLFCIVSIFFTRPDAEDNSWEIVHTAVETDTMYLYDEYSGYLSMDAAEGHAYSPMEMLYAAAVSLTGISETIALYYVVPICLLFFFYMAFWRIGAQFLKDRKQIMTFVGLSCMIYWMTTYLEGQSVVTGIFLNSWNGLTMLSCFVMPVVFSSLLQWLEFGQKKNEAILGKWEALYRVVIFILAGQLTNEKGGFYILLMLAAALFVKIIKKEQ